MKTIINIETQHRFKSEKQNIFIENINKIDSSLSDYKRMQSIDSTKSYENGRSKDLESEIKNIKCKNVIKRYKNDYL